MPIPPLQPGDVSDRLGYARRRKDDLFALNGGDLLGADAHERQQFTQEFFFHLIGAIEVLAQLVNERRGLGMNTQQAKAASVRERVPPADPLRAALESVYANPMRSSLGDHPDPYSGDGLMYRIWNYRHQVTHRRANPYFMRLTLGGARSDRSGHFVLDPRDDPPVGAARTAHAEMDSMFILVEERLEAALSLL